MRRIGLAMILAVSVVVVPFVGDAQQAGKIYRVGIRWPYSSSIAAP